MFNFISNIFASKDISIYRECLVSEDRSVAVACTIRASIFFTQVGGHINTNRSSGFLLCDDAFRDGCVKWFVIFARGIACVMCSTALLKWSQCGIS